MPTVGSGNIAGTGGHCTIDFEIDVQFEEQCAIRLHPTDDPVTYSPSGDALIRWIYKNGVGDDHYANRFHAYLYNRSDRETAHDPAQTRATGLKTTSPPIDGINGLHLPSLITPTLPRRLRPPAPAQGTEPPSDVFVDSNGLAWWIGSARWSLPGVRPGEDEDDAIHQEVTTFYGAVEMVKATYTEPLT